MSFMAAAQMNDYRLTRWAASWDSPWVRGVLPPVQDAADHTKLWWGAAAVLTLSGRRGRRAAVAGLAGMAVAELLSDAVAKRLVERRRPPKNWVPHPEVEDRPDSSSFPSGHTAAAVGFTAAAASWWPHAGAACAVPTLMVAIGRVHSGAHYPSDVAAGAGLGVVSACMVRAAPRLLRRLR